MSMIQAELRHLNSLTVPDVELEHFEPADPSDVCIGVTAYIGPRGKQGEDLFSFDVCTTRALERLAAEAEPGFIFGRHYIILNRYSYAAVRRAIETLCLEAQGADWEAVATWSARYGAWELEDYHEVPPPPAKPEMPSLSE
jgi:hypothetical protein